MSLLSALAGQNNACAGQNTDDCHENERGTGDVTAVTDAQTEFLCHIDFSFHSEHNSGGGPHALVSEIENLIHCCLGSHW